MSKEFNTQKLCKNMQNKKLLSLFIVYGICLLIIPLVSSQSIDDNVLLAQQFKKYDLKIPCQDSTGADCSAITVCNFTVSYPNGEQLLRSAGATNRGAYHNYTFQQGILTQIGEYQSKSVCTNTTDSGSYSFVLLVTPSGARNILGLFILIFIITYGITFIGAYFDNVPLVILGGMALIITGLYCVINGIDIYKNLATQSIAITTLGIGAYFATTAGIRIIQENL